MRFEIHHPSFVGRSVVRLLSNSHTVVLLCLWVVFTVVLGALYALTPPSPDQSIFDYIGWRALSGDALYVDVIEQNWPGAMWLHTLAAWLLGNHLWSFRLFDYGVMLGGAAGLFILAASSGLRSTGYIAVPLYQLMYVSANGWLTGQRDIIGAHLLIVLFALYLWASKQGRLRWMLVVGSGLAMVVMTRPSYLLFPVLLFAGELVLHRRDSTVLRRTLLAAVVAFVAFLGTLALIAAIGTATGGLQGWYEAAVLFNITAYSGSATSKEVIGVLFGTVASWHWYYGLGVIGALVWAKHGDRRVLWMLASLAITALVSFLVQGKAFGYHLGAWLPVLALLSAGVIVWAVKAVTNRRSFLAVAAGALIILIAISGSAKKAYSSLHNQSQYLLGQIDVQTYFRLMGLDFDGMVLADTVAVAAYLKEHSTESETVLVWNRGIVVNYLAERKSPLPFATVSMLNQFRTQSALSESWMQRAARAMYCAPPAYLILGINWTPSGIKNPLKSGAEKTLLPADQLIKTVIQEHYRLEKTIGGAQLWVVDQDRRPVCTKLM